MQARLEVARIPTDVRVDARKRKTEGGGRASTTDDPAALRTENERLRRDNERAWGMVDKMAQRLREVEAEMDARVQAVEAKRRGEDAARYNEYQDALKSLRPDDVEWYESERRVEGGAGDVQARDGGGSQEGQREAPSQ